MAVTPAGLPPLPLAESTSLPNWLVIVALLRGVIGGYSLPLCFVEAIGDTWFPLLFGGGEFGGSEGNQIFFWPRRCFKAFLGGFRQFQIVVSNL
jgi:hypothetical protein